MLFNYSWLHAKLSSCPLDSLLQDFQAAYEAVTEPAARRQVTRPA